MLGEECKENGAYLILMGIPEGKVRFIGEIATGWVRNIRAHVREGQRIVAKVIGIKRDRDSITLSIKSVSEERRRGHSILEERATSHSDNEGSS